MAGKNPCRVDDWGRRGRDRRTWRGGHLVVLSITLALGCGELERSKVSTSGEGSTGSSGGSHGGPTGIGGATGPATSTTATSARGSGGIGGSGGVTAGAGGGSMSEGGGAGGEGGAFSCALEQIVCPALDCTYLSTERVHYLSDECYCDLSRPVDASDCAEGTMPVCQLVSLDLEGNEFDPPRPFSCRCSAETTCWDACNEESNGEYRPCLYGQEGLLGAATGFLCDCATLF